MEHYETSIGNYADIINDNPLLSKEEEHALLKTIKEFKSGKQKQIARDKLIKSNLRMVFKEAGHYSKQCNVSLEDLVGAGIEGLCIAVDRYRLDKKTKLSTYAVPWIRLKVLRLLTSHSLGVYVPRHIVEQARKYRGVNDKSLNAMTAKELMKELKVTKRGLLNIRMAQGRVVSLNEVVINDDKGKDTTMQDLIADPRALPADKLLGDKDTKNRIQEELAKLDPVSIDIISRRYLSDEKEDLHVIGKDMNLTGERVRQIEFKALKLLRRRMKSRSSFGV